MNEELLRLAYQSLKRQFNDINKNSWIWTDFFEDEKVGFDYFKKQIEQDEDFAYLQDETYYLDEDLDELAYDIAYEIALKLKEKVEIKHNLTDPFEIKYAEERAKELLEKLEEEL